MHDLKSCKLQSIQSNANKRAQVFLFARIFYNITFAYKLKHLRFQLTQNENCKEHLDQARRLLRVLTPNSDPNRGRCPKGWGGGKCLIVGTPRRSLFCSHVFSYKTPSGVVRKKQTPASVRSYVIILAAVFLLCKQAIPRERRDDMLPADGDPKIAADLRPSADGSAVRTSLVADGG